MTRDDGTTFVCTKCNVGVDARRCPQGHRARRVRPIWIAIPQGVLSVAFLIVGVGYFAPLLAARSSTAANAFLSSGGDVPNFFLITMVCTAIAFAGSALEVLLAGRYRISGGAVTRLIPIVLVRGGSGLATFGAIMAVVRLGSN